MGTDEIGFGGALRGIMIYPGKNSCGKEIGFDVYDACWSCYYVR